MLEVYEVGYKKPPMHSRFKPGICPNPKGRGKRSQHQASDVLREILAMEIAYWETGKRKKASRAKLSVTRLVRAALNGKASEAAQLLKMRKHALVVDPGPLVIRITGGLPPDLDAGGAGPSSRWRMKVAGE